MSKSIKKNFAWNLLLTGSGYIIPLITYPYSSRILGVENMGICGYVDSIVNYFILFSALGVGTLGVREIARCKDDKEKRNKVYSSLLAINVSLTAIGAILLFILTYTLPLFSDYKDFLMVGILKLISQAFLVEWLFQGVQDFKYVTLRSLAIKFGYVIALFLFVRSKEDVLIYYSLSTAINVANCIWNSLYSQKYVRFKFDDISIKPFYVAVLSYGYYRILTSLYTTFNTFYLGSVSTNTEVGYFITATKLINILMAVFTAFTTVMIPKVAEMLNDRKIGELQIIANKTFSVLYALAVPMIVYCISYAPDIIFLLSGSGYEGAITPFRIIIFMLLIIGMEQIAIRQFLMGDKKSTSVTILSTVGAFVGISLNILLVKEFGSIGSSISWGCSELCVLIVGLWYLKKDIGICLNINQLLSSLFSSLIYVFPIILVNYLVDNRWLKLIISASFLIVIFLIVNVRIKNDSYIAEVFNKTYTKFKK